MTHAETLTERFRGVKNRPYDQAFHLRLVSEKLPEAFVLLQVSKASMSRANQHQSCRRRKRFSCMTTHRVQTARDQGIESGIVKAKHHESTRPSGIRSISLGSGVQSASPNDCNGINGRGERIRTSGLLVPNQARYQASLRPDGLRQPFYHSLIAPSPQLAVLSNTR